MPHFREDADPFVAPAINRIGGLSASEIKMLVTEREQTMRKEWQDTLKPISDAVTRLSWRMEKLIGDGDGDAGTIRRNHQEILEVVRNGFLKQSGEIDTLRRIGDERDRRHTEQQAENLKAVRSNSQALTQLHDIVDHNSRIIEDHCDRLETVEQSAHNMNAHAEDMTQLSKTMATNSTIVARHSEDVAQKSTLFDGVLEIANDAVTRRQLTNVGRLWWKLLKRHGLLSVLAWALNFGALSYLAVRQWWNHTHPNSTVILPGRPSLEHPSADAVIPKVPTVPMPAEGTR